MNPYDIQKLQFERMKEAVLRKILTKEARERLGRIRIVKPELAAQLEVYLVQLYQSGQIKTVINDEKLKVILRSLSSKKRFRIIR